VTDHDLIQRTKTGDSQAFSLLYETHKRRVFSLCFSMIRDHELAEDITHDAFLLAFRRLNSFRGDSAFSTWLHRIAVNSVLMHIRHSKSRISAQLSIDEMNSIEDDSGFEVVGAEDRRLGGSIDRIALINALDELPPGYRAVLVLHDIEGYNHQEIAEMLGCSVGNTKSQLHKARLKMRSLLNGTTEDITSVIPGSEPETKRIAA
jgi:RNA polymerase sigma-70 factor (ECF subfamily)